MAKPKAKKDKWKPDVVIYTDASVQSDGETSVGFVLESVEGDLITEESYILSESHTSHVAEYIAVLKAVAEAKKNGYKDPVIYTDYKVIVDHVFGDASVDDEACKNIKGKLISLLKEGFNKWMLEWIPRDMNEKAHTVARGEVAA